MPTIENAYIYFGIDASTPDAFIVSVYEVAVSAKKKE